MKTTFVFISDGRGYSLTEQAVAAAMATQRTTRHIIIFCVGFTPSSGSRLILAGRREGFDIEFREIEIFDEATTAYTASGAHAHVTSATMLKMSVLDLLSAEFNRAVYLDFDILLMENFNIENIDFDGHPVAAVYDIAKVGGMVTEPYFYENCLKNGRSPHYFNAGVIAADFGVWDSGIVANYDRAVQSHSATCHYIENCSCPDQCAWNMAFERNWKRLPLTMNLQACAMFSERWQYASVRHYVGKAKFMPFKARRNDTRDTELINKARKYLGLPPIRMGWSRFIRPLNVWRNRWQTDSTCEAINRVEKMYSQKM